ncbi:sulfurtransferase [Natrialbaceae archaeon AArc-T1-2]|uniref:sulfurtransferase n=1 Tax=Natrialbaceae archaeon AArc-T1-2 TaxID=3053904 RepID=UPI00255ADBC8|nr:rhodanese-like domain-containing protein [Natrialbaceae archaeon AArc-T1-2]WIV68212.1 rhodanese-like domain-containing protein [Natrialbaceae archaeon AArc-T1-2]
MTLHSLSEETLLSSRTARSGLEKLHKADLIESIPLEEDRRKNLYSLTSTDRANTRSGEQPSPLVSAEWVEDNLDEFERDNPELRLIEADDEYDQGHIPSAVQVDVTEDFNEPGRHTLVDRPEFENRMSTRGITENSTVVIYSTRQNQLAAYLYWLFKYYRHTDVRLLEGGKERWQENGGQLVEHEPSTTKTEYSAHPSNERIRAYRHDIEEALEQDAALLDVRTAEEFTGESACPIPDLPEARNTGRIPQTIHLEWTSVLDDSGEFKERSQLEDIFHEKDIYPHDRVIAYCHVGWRSALIWFVLSELLNYPDVSNYDGSWIEWGNLVDAPIKGGSDLSEST